MLQLIWLLHLQIQGNWMSVYWMLIYMGHQFLPWWSYMESQKWVKVLFSFFPFSCRLICLFLCSYLIKHLLLSFPPLPLATLAQNPSAVTDLNHPADLKMIPVENYGVQCMSIGFLVDKDAPIVWRGPMVCFCHFCFPTLYC